MRVDSNCIGDRQARRFTVVVRPSLGYGHVVTVDGASGTGKTSLLLALASRYRCRAVEIGPIVRLVGWLAARDGVPVSTAVASLAVLDRAGYLDIAAPGGAAYAASDVVLLGAETSKTAFSAISDRALASVSSDTDALSWIFALVQQNVFGLAAIVSGRQVAHRIGLGAGLRIRLDASVGERARRKQRQILRAGRDDVWRDDSYLVVGPTTGAQVTIDTTTLSPDAVADIAGAEIERRLGWNRVQIGGGQSAGARPRTAPMGAASAVTAISSSRFATGLRTSWPSQAHAPRPRTRRPG
jgi:cytidylate kinase